MVLADYIFKAHMARLNLKDLGSLRMLIDFLGQTSVNPMPAKFNAQHQFLIAVVEALM